MADLEINDQYDFFKNVKLDESGALRVKIEAGSGFSYIEDNYAALSLVTGMVDGELAYVESPQGTQWLPATLGGTYYPSGIYLYNGTSWVSDRNEISLSLNDILKNRVVVTQDNYASTIGGTIDSSKEYFIDGIVDLGSTQITVPSTGISIKGYNFDASGLVSSENNYSMFVSDVGGSGNVLMSDLYLTASGTNSSVYNLVDATGFNAIEVNVINYIACTSLGVIDNYRQGLETGTGRFGGTPELELKGVWVGGYFIDTSIVRGLTDGSYSLYKAGAGFLMSSRFRTNQNIDLPASVSFCDFSTSNFVNPSTLQVTNMIVTRAGVSDATDSNYFPNIDEKDIASIFTDNQGLPNTFVGGRLNLSTEVTTSITFNTPTPILGTFTASELQHFDSPANGQLRHLGKDPREYLVNFDLVLEGGSNDDYKLELVVNDGSDTVVYSQTRVVNNIVGGRDVAYFTGGINIVLDQNSYCFWQVTNLSDASDCTLELDSSFTVNQR